MKVIAVNITNLTDARYFAAWGVELLGYVTDDHHPSKVESETIIEISEWIEGPVSAFCFDGLDIPENIEELSVSLGISQAIIGPFIEKKALPPSITKVYRKGNIHDDFTEEDVIIINLSSTFDDMSQADLQSISNLTSSREVYISGHILAEDLPRWASLLITGVVVSGGEEDKIGFKSFEMLDELFEGLEELR